MFLEQRRGSIQKLYCLLMVVSTLRHLCQALEIAALLYGRAFSLRPFEASAVMLFRFINAIRRLSARFPSVPCYDEAAENSGYNTA